MTLLPILRDFFTRTGTDKTYLIAYSGGVDSHVLLSLCHALRDELSLKLQAIHVNHQLSSNANDWALHCQKICTNYQINLIEQRVDLALEKGDSLEEVARNKRYAVFEALMTKESVLLTAHHQDDQAETMLLQLLRGAGLKGLSAMPVTRGFGVGIHARPLLSVSRAEIGAYASLHALQWVDDESNRNIKLSRNFLRKTVIPQLASRWPKASNSIARSALHCAEAQSLLNGFATELLQETMGSQMDTLSVTRLLALAPEKQRLAIRSWIHANDFPLPPTHKLETIRQDVLQAAWDSTPCVAWGDVELRRHRDDIYLMPKLIEHENQQVIEWSLEQVLAIPGVGVLSAVQQQGGLNIKDNCVSLRFRQGGEVIELPGRGGHTLKNMLQEWGVPTWLRDRLPLIYVQEKLVSVVGYFVDASVCVKDDELGYDIRWVRQLTHP